MTNDLIKAAVLTNDLFYPYQQARLNLATYADNQLSEEINTIFFTDTPFTRVIKGEKYEDVEKSVLEEIEEFNKNGLIKTKS